MMHFSNTKQSLSCQLLGIYILKGKNLRYFLVIYFTSIMIYYTTWVYCVVYMNLIALIWEIGKTEGNETRDIVT